MENSYKYFENRQCRYFPCHKTDTGTGFNCLFCYCPLNRYEDCPGNPVYRKNKAGKLVKDCSGCIFPHKPENYEKIIAYLSEKNT